MRPRGSGGGRPLIQTSLAWPNDATLRQWPRDERWGNFDGKTWSGVWPHGCARLAGLTGAVGQKIALQRWVNRHKAAFVVIFRTGSKNGKIAPKVVSFNNDDNRKRQKRASQPERALAESRGEGEPGLRRQREMWQSCKGDEKATTANGGRARCTA